MAKVDLKRVKQAVQREEPGSFQEGTSGLEKRIAAEEAAEEPAYDSADEEAEVDRLVGLLETGFLAVAADGELADEEIENMGANFASWLGGQLAPAQLATLLDGFAEALETEGLEGRLAALAELLDDASRRTAFNFACVLVACDGDIADAELGVLGDIAEVFAIPEEEAQDRFHRIAKQVAEVTGR